MTFRSSAQSLAALLFAGVLAIAGTGSASALDSDAVERFTASMEALHAYEDENPFDLDEPEEPEEFVQVMRAPMSSQLDQMRDHEAFGDVQRIVGEHGFADVESWAVTGDRVLRAFTALEIEEETPDLRAELEQTRAQIQEAPGMSQEQRDMALKMIEQTMVPMMEVLDDVPQEDRDAVAPHRSRIADVLKE